MDFLISSAYAQAAEAAPAPAGGIGGLLGSPIIFIVIMAGMMFFMFRLAIQAAEGTSRHDLRSGQGR